MLILKYSTSPFSNFLKFMMLFNIETIYMTEIKRVNIFSNHCNLFRFARAQSWVT